MAAYFYFSQESPEGQEQKFVFKLVEDTKIDQARELIRTGNKLSSHVQGTVIPAQAPYNPAWSFHLRPESIGFFELQIEVCDANVSYVQEHLDEVGGSFLPRSFWCPWSSQLAGEITDKIDPHSEELR